MQICGILPPSLPHFLSVPRVKFPPLSPPSFCLFSIQSRVGARVGTYSYRLHQDTPKTSRTYYTLWRPGNTCTPVNNSGENRQHHCVITISPALNNSSGGKRLAKNVFNYLEALQLINVD